MAAKFISKEITAKSRTEVKNRPVPRGHGRKGATIEGTIAPPPGGSTHGESVKIVKKRQRDALCKEEQRELDERPKKRPGSKPGQKHTRQRGRKLGADGPLEEELAVDGSYDSFPGRGSTPGG